MIIKGSKLEYIARNCTDSEYIYKDIDCIINGDSIIFYLPPPYDHDFKLTLKYYKGNHYLLNNDQIKEIEFKKDDYWYTRAFKKTNNVQ